MLLGAKHMVTATTILLFILGVIFFLYACEMSSSM